MARWVLLRHELPDGSWHHDWMFEHPSTGDAASAAGGAEGAGGAGGGLITFKLEPSVSWPPEAGFEAERLADHRREYLEYEGPISGGRGGVRRVASGECRVEADVEHVRAWLEGRVFVGRAAGGAAARRWRFRVHAEGDLEES
jgi:hypothetical protein